MYVCIQVKEIDMPYSLIIINYILLLPVEKWRGEKQSLTLTHLLLCEQRSVRNLLAA